MRLIDSDQAASIENLDQYSDLAAALGDVQTVRDILADAPIVDPVHAAGGCYCRECRYADNSAGPNILCKKFYGAGSMDGFCYWGQKEADHD